MKKLFQNKFLALLLVFVMIWGMLPANVMAASQTVKVAGIELADGQCLTNNSATSATTWTEGDPYVAYYKDGVLYLNNLETEQVNSCIYFKGNSDLIIDVTGNNTLVRTDGTCINVESYTYGLVVQGTGTLTATGSSFGFWVRDNVTFQGNVTVVAEGTSDVGIASNRGNTGLSDTKITIKDNARVTATGGKYGIGGDHDRTPKVVVEDNAVVTAKGGTHAIRTLTAETVSNQKVFAGTDISGNSKETYIAANNSTYKYVEVNPTTYVATVIDGTGSGAYSAGTAVTITANAAPSGKQFKEWTGTAGLTFTSGSKDSATATFIMPANAVTVSATYENRPYEEYDLWIGGVRVTSDNASNITGADISGTVSYDAGTNTLTLNNATVGAYEFGTFWHDTSCIYSENDLIINLVGNNTLTGTDKGGSSYGIYLDSGNLTFTGNGSLTVTAADLSEAKWSVAVFADGTITVEESCTITACCGDSEWVTRAFYSYANNNKYVLPNVPGVLVAGNKNAPNATNLEVCNNNPDAFQYLKIAPGYTVMLNTNGGAVNSGNVTCYFVDTGATLPTDVTKSGCNFAGWYDNSGLTGEAVTSIPANATGNKEYWAKWTSAHTCDIQPVAKVEPTCTESGKEAHYKCEGCGKFFEDANGTTEITDIDSWGTLTNLGHTESTQWKSDGDNHWHICSVADCGAVIDSSKAAHTPDRAAATETDPVKCSVCGYEIAPALGHTHTYGTDWKSDKDNHWHVCSCGDKANTAAHKDGNVDGKCDVCAYNVGVPMPPADPSNPQTGDNSMPVLWITLLLVSGFAVVAFGFYGKKRYSAK